MPRKSVDDFFRFGVTMLADAGFPGLCLHGIEGDLWTRLYVQRIDESIPMKRVRPGPTLAYNTFIHQAPAFFFPGL